MKAWLSRAWSRVPEGAMRLGLVVLLMGVCAMAARAAGKTLTIAYNEEPKTSDMQMNTDDYLIPLNVYDRLVECVTTGPGKSSLVPGLATAWKVSANGKVYTFHLRKGVKFHNGEELTAQDVVYTFDRMLDPATKALNTDILDFVLGAKDRMSGKANYTVGLKALDKYTVQIILEDPFVPFLAIMASPQASILNEKFTRPLGASTASARIPPAAPGPS